MTKPVVAVPLGSGATLGRALHPTTRGSDARRVRVGPWQVWVQAAAGVDEARAWITLVERLAAREAPIRRSKHALTYRTRGPTEDVYIKIYPQPRHLERIKGLVRPSKGLNVLRTSRALARAGFRAPRVLAAGELRAGPIIRRSWVAMAPLAGRPVHRQLTMLTITEKRRLLTAVGAEIARLHGAGFTAGDLVPENVWIISTDDGPRVAFLDNDRTRAGRTSTPWCRARRNLVQLNRALLPGVTATDRLRVYRAYAAGRAWAPAVARRRLPQIIAKTAKRRRQAAARPPTARPAISTDSPAP